MHMWILTTVIGAVCAEPLNCSYLSLLEHLGLGPNNYRLSSVRPVRNWTTPTYATVDLYLFVIADVNEKFQSFTTGVSMTVSWKNEFLQWNPKDFCGIKQFSVPKEYVWRPHFNLLESIEAKQSNVESTTQVLLKSSDVVFTGDIYKITSTCRMDLYKFPFDTQRCQLTLVAFHSRIEELRLFHVSNFSDVTAQSLVMFQSQGEWDLVSIHVSKKILDLGPEDTWDQLVYKITIARRSQLYVINFLVPLLIFLVLDLMSYLMNESGGEKLGFKVTILLAISVLLLILHDILPSTHQRTPVIGMFCAGVFLFVGCSIVETITVSFLMRMASKCDARALTWRTPEKSDGEATNQTADGAGAACSTDRKSGAAALLRLILAEMQLLRTHIFSDHHPEHHGKARACLCMKTVAKWINAVYFLLYLCAVCGFLLWTGRAWFS